MFFDSLDGFFWHDELNVALRNEVYWERELFVQPIVGVLDEFEKYAVALVDRANMRLFSMFLGEVKEVAHRKYSRHAVQHVKSVGMDHLGSASRAQQKADEHVRANLRRTIRALNALVESERTEHLILAGTPEITTELFDLLPKRLALLVVGSIDLPLNASPEQVRSAVSEVAEGFERSAEISTVREVTTAAEKTRRAVLGLSRTLNAINHGRVWQLIYSAGYRSSGYECTKCGALDSFGRNTCMYCGGPMQAVSDVVAHAVEHGLRRGARIEVVKGDAAEALNVRGGIAAFLKARTATVNL
jgi:peptide subunit release factor 1 (eRF1)